MAAKLAATRASGDADGTANAGHATVAPQAYVPGKRTVRTPRASKDQLRRGSAASTGASGGESDSTKRFDEVDEREHGMTRGALRIDTLGAIGQHGPGHVTVDPRRVADELLQEQRGRDR